MLITHIATTFFMTGLIWFVQVVHYPLMAEVGIESFQQYEVLHANRTTSIVLPVMLIELITGFLLLASFETSFHKWIFISAFVLLCVIWVSTFAVQIPLHSKLSQGFTVEIHQQLVHSNWVRTVAWTLRSLLLCFILHHFLTSKP